MKDKIAILTDTNSGLMPAQANSLGIHLISMPVIIDGEVFFEGTTITHAEFYDRLRGGSEVGTSQPSPGDLMEAWELLLEDYEEVVYIPMSSGLSGGCGTAQMLAADYDGRVFVADNHRISVTQRQSVLEAKAMADQGRCAAEILEHLNSDGLNASIYIAVNTLDHLKKSGRVTAAGAAIATVLSIKPVLQIQGGKLDAFKKVRGMNAAMDAIVDGLRRDRETRFRGQRIVIRAAWTGGPEIGEAWQAYLQKAFPDLRIEKDPLAFSVACHTGDGALGVGIMPERFTESGCIDSFRPDTRDRPVSVLASTPLLSCCGKPA